MRAGPVKSALLSSQTRLVFLNCAAVVPNLIREFWAGLRQAIVRIAKSCTTPCRRAAPSPALRLPSQAFMTGA